MARTLLAWVEALADVPDERGRARSFLEEALAIADEIGMQGIVPKAEALRRRLEAAPGPSPAEAGATRLFRREGHFWTIGREDGSVLRLKDMKGLRFIAHLLRHPGVEFRSLELAAIADDAESDDASRVEAPGKRELAEAGLVAADLGDAGEILDARAKTEYRERLSDLREDLEEARANNDRGLVERLSEEIEALTRELTAAVGLGGRDRRAAAPAERARVAVTKAIRTAIAAIAKEDAELGRELQRTVRTGSFFSFRPEGSSVIAWTVS